MRLELNIPETALTPSRRGKYTALARKLETQPEFIDAIEISSGPNSKVENRHKIEVSPLTEEELRQLDSLGGAFGLLADQSDETIDKVMATILRTKQEGFPDLA